jgi:hypothetical protein
VRARAAALTAARRQREEGEAAARSPERKASVAREAREAALEAKAAREARLLAEAEAARGDKAREYAAKVHPPHSPPPRSIYAVRWPILPCPFSPAPHDDPQTITNS